MIQPLRLPISILISKGSSILSSYSLNDTVKFIRASNNQMLSKKSLSTQKSFSKIAEKKPSKINDENKDCSNCPIVNKHQNLTTKFQKMPVNNKSQVPQNIKAEENSKENLMKEILKTYNDPKMRTKTLPDYFNIDCLKDLDFSLEKLPKKSENNSNVCFKSIDDFSLIQRKIKQNEDKMSKKTSSNKNIIDIRDLEKFFNKKNDKNNDFHSPNNNNNNTMRFVDRVKVNSNYEKEKERGKTAAYHAKKGELEGAFQKSRAFSKET